MRGGVQHQQVGWVDVFDDEPGDVGWPVGDAVADGQGPLQLGNQFGGAGPVGREQLPVDPAGGWYTARWVDRLLFPANWPSATELIPELQQRPLAVGDRIPDGPPDTAWFVVEHIDPPRLLLRVRGLTRPWWLTAAYVAALVPADYIMSFQLAFHRGVLSPQKRAGWTTHLT